MSVLKCWRQFHQSLSASVVSFHWCKLGTVGERTTPSSFIHTSSTIQRTIQQIIRQGPFKKDKKKKHLITGRPQLRGIVLQTFTRKPRKPNSAQRKCCRVKLSTGKIGIAHIPYEGHTLQEGNVVLIRGGRCKDIGTHIKVIRGKYDCGHPVK